MSEETTIHIADRPGDPYTRILNSTLRDARLSFKARGILTFMLGQPKNWETRIGWIEEQTSEGRESIRSAFLELEKFGYLTREVRRDSSGLHLGYLWRWYEVPVTASGNPSPGNHRQAATRQPSRTKEIPEQRKEEEGHPPPPSRVATPPRNPNSITPKQLKDLWETTCPSFGKLSEITAARLKSAKARGTPQRLAEVFAMVEASDLLTGRSPTKEYPNWKASFDWVLNPSNFAKIAEGNYTNKPKTTPSSGRSDSANLPGRYD